MDGYQDLADINVTRERCLFVPNGDATLPGLESDSRSVGWEMDDDDACRKTCVADLLAVGLHFVVGKPTKGSSTAIGREACVRYGGEGEAGSYGKEMHDGLCSLKYLNSGAGSLLLDGD